MAMIPQTMRAGSTVDIKFDANGKWSISDVSIPSWENKQYRFVAPRDASLTAYSKGGSDTMCYLLDSEGYELTYDDDSGDGGNFSLKYNIKSGNTYILKVAAAYDNITNSSIYMELNEPTFSADVYYKIGDTDSFKDSDIACIKNQYGINTYVDNLDSGSKIDFCAQQIDGATFVGWYSDLNGKPVSTQANYTATITADIELIAVYSIPKGYSLIYVNSISYNSEVTINGNKSMAIVPTNSTVTLNALPYNAYEFKGWTLNPEPSTGNVVYLKDANGSKAGPHFNYTVTGNARIYALCDYTGVDRPQLYSVNMGYSYYYLRYYDMFINAKGEYQVELVTNVLPSKDNNPISYEGDYYEGTPEITYTSQTDGSVMVTIKLSNSSRVSTYKLIFREGYYVDAHTNVYDGNANITCIANGKSTTSSYINGRFVAGTQVTFVANSTNKEEYVFKEWYQDDELGNKETISTSNTVNITVDKECNIYADFISRPIVNVVQLSDGTYMNIGNPVKNEDGEYEATVTTTQLPSEDNPITSIMASYWDSDDADCSYTCSYTPNADGTVLFTLKLTNKLFSSTFKITFEKINLIETGVNEGRGSVKQKAGEEEYTLSEYSYWLDRKWPVGTDVTITAVPADGCKFVKWRRYDEKLYKYVDYDMPNPFTTNETISVLAIFSSSTEASVSVEVAGPADGVVKTKSGKLDYYMHVNLGTELTFSFEKYNLSEGELPGLKFVGWYDQATDNLVSDKEQYTTTANADTKLYAQFINEISTPNGWIGYCDGFKRYNVEGGEAYTTQYVADSDGNGTPAVNLIPFSLNDRNIPLQNVILHDTDNDGKVTLRYNLDRIEGASTIYNGLYGNDGWYWDDDQYNETGEGDCFGKEMPLPSSRYTYYELTGQSQKPVFSKYTSDVLPPHRVVFCLKGTDNPQTLRVTINGKDPDATTAMKIAQLISDNMLYDLNGRRVISPSKGVYIKNGKKVVVK